MATWWPLVARVSGKSWEIQTCSIFFETFSSLQQVLETSPSVAATSRRLIFFRDWGDVSVTSLRPAGDQWDWGDVAATSPQCCLTHFRDCRRRRCNWEDISGDVAATAGNFRVNWLSPCLETSLRRRLGERASHFWVARVAATDQPLWHLRHWDSPLSLCMQRITNSALISVHGLKFNPQVRLYYHCES